MTENGGGTTETETLRDSVATGRDNEVTVEAFTVVRVECPYKWDPQEGRLPVTYTVENRNERAVSGRILYCVSNPEETSGTSDSDENQIVVHSQNLRQDQFTHGPHELTGSDQWDGTLSEGLDDRRNERITADLSPVRVVVELWDHNDDSPGREDQRVSRAHTHVHIDAIAEGRWDDNKCIPYIETSISALEPDLMQTKMIVEVKNVREGASVRILVARISDPQSNTLRPEDCYIQTGQDTERHPGLQGAVVRDGQIVLEDGTEPWVRWRCRTKHWVHENQCDFYCFYVAFGERGGFQLATQRDYVNHERDCLHMRFTVFVHAPYQDLSTSISAARRLHRFFRRRTKYFRSYLMTGAPRDVGSEGAVDVWLKHASYRYMVILFTHASTECYYGLQRPEESEAQPAVEASDRHPTDASGDPKDCYRHGFPPDQNVCPTTGRPRRNRLGGCGQKDRVAHWNCLGKMSRNATHRGTAIGERKVLYLGNYGLWDQGLQERALRAKEERQARGGGNITREEDLGNRLWLVMDSTRAYGLAMLYEWGPRFLMHAGGCRTIMTTNCGEFFTRSNTKFFGGWTYVSDESQHFIGRLMRRWILGTRNDRPSAENLTDRFVRIWASVTSSPRIRSAHPRLIDQRCRPVAPGQLEDLLL
jgi:hypothetical protein